MNAAPFAVLKVAVPETETPFRAIFEHAPIAVACCNRQGVIIERNAAFERTLDIDISAVRSFALCDLVPAHARDKVTLLLRELLDAKRDSFTIETRGGGNECKGAVLTAWRQSGCGDEPDHALLMADLPTERISVDESLIQTQRWEAIGRLTGGVAHDFNNLLTGVMLYCDLLLASLDSRDCRRRYADEIRLAIMQASGLVQQLLVFARPRATPAHTLNLNEVAKAMHGLLTRLIGENIALDLLLDPELGGVKIDQAQAQQILLNLVLNARDALPGGGRIMVETSNCKFQPMAGATGQNGFSGLPCVLLIVADNGEGMSAETRKRLFDPFFSTKSAGKGTGLGLTTVRSIVTTNRGLIHFESEPGRGTRVMILLPRAVDAGGGTEPLQTNFEASSGTPLQETKKDTRL
jgi:two-component system, cell cycle sensor histidine kinase and response regulator CckA